MILLNYLLRTLNFSLNNFNALISPHRPKGVGKRQAMSFSLMLIRPRLWGDDSSSQNKNRIRIGAKAEPFLIESTLMVDRELYSVQCFK